MTSDNAYTNLSPDDVLNTVDQFGYQTDGRLLALNSYENRVYRVGLYDGSSIIAKFYRPNRWSNAAILEEHRFTQELSELEIPVIAPITITDETLLITEDYRLALFKNRGGRAPDLEDFDQLEQMGRFMGRIHQVSKSRNFIHRPSLNTETFGYDPRNLILSNNFIPQDLLPAYETLTQQLLNEVAQCYERAGDIR